MNIPTLDLAFESVAFYHAHITTHEADRFALEGLPLDFRRGFQEEMADAIKVYHWASRQIFET